jgi:hypothetical protein
LSLPGSGVAHHGQFERRGLEPHVAARGIAKHETKVDVNEMSITVDQDVAVMSILDLQKEGNDTVRRQRLDEVALCLSETSGLRISIRLLQRGINNLRSMARAADVLTCTK